MVGEDYINCEKKHKDPFDFKSTARMIFSCNRLPENFGDNSEGFYRRLLIIPFNRTIPENERDPHLTQKLIAEADGIFMFALAGLKRLMANNFIFSETDVNKEIIKKYRKEGNSVVSFINDCCKVTANCQVGSSELYEAYKNYCEECGFIPHAINKFVSQLTSNFSVERKIDTNGQKRILCGIAMITE